MTIRPLLLPVLILAFHPSTAAPEGMAGPLIGHLTPTTARIWMYAPNDAKVTITWRPDAGDLPEKTAAFTPVPDPAAEKDGRPATVTLEGLAPDTRYRYVIKVNNLDWPGWSADFKTPPPAGSPHKFRIVLTSCMKFDQPQNSWSHLLVERPDLHLTVGDTHYADTTDPNVQWDHHLRYRNILQFAAVVRTVPTYSMWDDHDYGPNDSDRTAAGKERSLEGWKQFWANPGAGTPDTPGAFYAFNRGEVDFFVVDGRYHRSPDQAPDDDQKRMLGDAQFEWLLEGLKASKAKFKVVASGSTLDHSTKDGWKIYTFARHRFFDALKEHRISGVVYMSGDIHRSLVWKHHESERVGYPLLEVISSGIANSETRSFATVDFDTTVEDPTMRVRIILGDRTVETDKTWKLSELTPE